MLEFKKGQRVNLSATRKQAMICGDTDIIMHSYGDVPQLDEIPITNDISPFVLTDELVAFILP